MDFEKLQWPLFIEKLVAFARTEEGKDKAAKLPVNLSAAQVEASWQDLMPLKRLIGSGYHPPLSELARMEASFRAAELGQILDGEDFRDISALLALTRNVQRFTADFQEKCSTLVRFQAGIYPLPKLALAIEKTVGPDGGVLDSASPELQRIRSGKISLRKKIEHEIKQLLIDQEVETYLQDKFFTMRSERYVVPIRLDGRGRVKGSIYDTSDSGQTLFVEPQAIAPLNDQLQELELAEKLEILRILKELSAHVARELPILSTNYTLLIELDLLSAKAEMAASMDATAVHMSTSPLLRFRNARHPLVMSPGGGPAVANDVLLDKNQRTLIVSGPNAGGKTIVLKTVGFLHLMAKAGLLLPMDADSEIYLFKHIHLELGDAQNLTANLSTFSGHLMGLRPILDKAGDDSLVLLDELAVGTEPQTGAAIAQAILEDLTSKGAYTVVTTHYDALKFLAMNDERYRNGSMEFSRKNLKPTYRLILDVPGQSYGLEVAEQLGFPIGIVRRARELRGAQSSQVDQLMESLSGEREKLQHERRHAEKARLEHEAQRSHWEKERATLSENRAIAVRKMRESFDDEMEGMRRELNDTLERLKTSLRQIQKGDAQSLEELRQVVGQDKKVADERLQQMEHAVSRLESSFQIKKDIPGRPCTIQELKVGDRVFVLSLDKDGEVLRLQGGAPDTLEVQVGLVKLRVNVQEIRLLDAPLESKKPSVSKPPRSATAPAQAMPALVIPSPTNSLDLRGFEADRGVEKMWEFIDRALLRGEQHLIVIHGHGTDRLKRAIRTALAKNPPYEINFRPGESEEGGDGVTVVQLCR